MATDTIPMRSVDVPKEGQNKMKESPIGKISTGVIGLVLSIFVGYVFNTVNSHERLIAAHAAEINNLTRSVDKLTEEMRMSFRELRNDIKESKR